MATRDILVLNTTASRAETQQGSDTVVIRGNSGEALSVENSSGVSVLSVNTISSSTSITGDITASGDVKITGTGSFGRLEGATLIGSAFNLSDTAILGTISASSQIASQISGSFREGFEFTGEISGSSQSTGSFGRIEATTFVGDANELTNTQLDNTISGSAQIASQISGSFNKGFEFTGTISGSATSTGSFTQLDVGKLTGDGSTLTNVIITDTVSGSAQLATRISGSFNKGFEFTGTIKGAIGYLAGGSWSAGPDTDHDHYQARVVGIQNAALVAGGWNNGGAKTEEYNGTAWSEGNDTPSNLSRQGGFGSQNAAIMAGGDSAPTGTIVTETLLYNGTNWSDTGHDLPTTNGNKWLSSGGVSSEAGAVFGGHGPESEGVHEEYNGSTWTEKTGMSDKRYYMGATGESTEAYLAAGGYTGGSPYRRDETEEWNGTNWSNGPDLPNAEFGLSLTGTTNDALAFGGYIQSPSAVRNYSWDGSAWSNAVAMSGNTTKGDPSPGFGALGGGASTAGALSVGGAHPSRRKTEEFTSGPQPVTGSFGRVEATTIVGSAANLTNTTLAGTISSSAQIASYISGSHTSGFEFTGTISGSQTSTGSFTTVTATTLSADASKATNTIPTDTVSGSAQLATAISGSFNKGFEFTGTIQTSPTAWSVGANMPGNWAGGAGAGRTQNAALHWSGRGPSSNATSNCSVEWNGTSWSATNNFNKAFRRHSGAGTTESALSVGGYDYPNALESSEYFNGTNWAEKATLPHRGMDGATVGESADILLVGGGDHPGVSSANVDKYSLSGNSWSQESDAPTNVGGEGAAGTTEAAIIPIYSPSEGSITYNGSNWTEVASTLTDRGNGVGIFGTVNNAVAVGGCANAGADRACTEIWNGSSWSSGNAMNNGRTLNNGRTVGTKAAGLAFSTGYSSVSGPAWSCDTELWNEYITTGSFGRVDATTFSGTGANLTGLSDGLVSGSGQFASYISGSFTSGFEVAGNISGSATSTGSFTHVNATTYVGDISQLTGTDVAGTISSSAQIASQISGSFNKGFEFNGAIKPAMGIATAGPPMVRGRRHSIGGASSQNSALSAGGYITEDDGAANAWNTCTEIWNGTAWSEVNDLINGQSGMGQYFGDASSGHLAGGAPYQSTGSADWNGTNWSIGAAFINATGRMGGFGESGTGLIAGGSNPAKVSEQWYSGRTEVYPGTAYEAAAGQLFSVFDQGSGTGTVNSGISAGGAASPFEGELHYITAQEWDGSSWSTAGSINQRRCYTNMAGTTNDATMFGGAYPSPYNVITGYQVEKYDGVSWTMASNQLLIHRARHSSGGSSAAAINFGGTYASPMGTPTSLERGPDTEFWDEMQVTASIGRWDVDRLTGDLSNLTVSGGFSLQSTLPSGTISSSFQLTDQICGSFGGGFTTTGDIKPIIGTWSEGGSLNVFRRFGYPSKAQGSTGGGYIAGGLDANGIPSQIEHTELWNGVAWTIGADMITGRAMGGGAGTDSAGVAFGGYDTPGAVTATEEYNGTSWATATAMGTAKSSASGGGTQTAAILAGNNDSTVSCIYDGTNWFTNVNMLYNQGATDGYVGTVNSGMVAGGYSSPDSRRATAKFNGIAWSQAESLTVSNRWGSAYIGNSQNNSVIASGNNPGSVTCTEKYDGTTWSTAASLSHARQYANAFGNGNDGLIAGGDPGTTWNPYRASYFTELYQETTTTGSFGRIETPNVSIVGDTSLEVNESLQLPIFSGSVFPVTSSAGEVWYNCTEQKLYFTYDINSWSSTAELNTGGVRGYFGTTGAGLAAGRWNYPAITAPYQSGISEEWNGTSWTEVNDLIHYSEVQSNNLVGIVNAGLALGHNMPSAGRPNIQKWDGSSWTEETQLTVGCSYGNSVAGTQNAAVSAGGRNGSHGTYNCTIEYNGTTGYAAATAPSAIAATSVAGTQNDAYYWGGTFPNLESANYNGTSWASGVSHIRLTYDAVSAGTANAAISAGGCVADDGSTTSFNGYTCVEEYNGTAWYVANSLNVAQTGIGGDGSQSSAFAVGKRTAFALNSESSETEQYTTTGIGCHCIGGV